MIEGFWALPADKRTPGTFRQKRLAALLAKQRGTAASAAAEA
jgi:hypothetical protein